MQKEGEVIAMTWKLGSMEAGGLNGKEKENSYWMIFIPVSILIKKEKKKTIELPAKTIQISQTIMV